MRNKNIYMGANSTARMPVFGRVDTEQEICLNAMATGYDALNSKMLTRQFGIFDKTTMAKINSRFNVLRMLCRKYAISKLNVVNSIQDVAVKHFKGNISDSQAFSLLRQICSRYSLSPDIFNIAALHVNKAEKMQRLPGGNGIDMFLFLRDMDKKTKYKRRGGR